MKMIDPTAMSRFTALREAAGKIDRLVPHVRLMEQPPHESRDTASVALEFPTPLVVLNSTIRQALSFLFSACDTVQTDKTERGICFTFTVSKMWIKEDVEEAPSAAGMPTATVTFSIPNGHTLAKGPTVAKGMLSNRADLLHSYCDEEGCICMEYILNLTWTEGVPS